MNTTLIIGAAIVTLLASCTPMRHASTMTLSTPPPVSLTVQSIGTNFWMGVDYTGSQVGTQYVSARIEFRNTGTEPICYRSFMAPMLADFRLRYSASSGLPEHEREVSRLRSCRGISILAPSAAVTFSAVIDSDRPCMITVDYSDAQTNRWFSSVTDVIDWSQVQKR